MQADNPVFAELRLSSNWNLIQLVATLTRGDISSSNVRNLVHLAFGPNVNYVVGAVAIANHVMFILAQRLIEVDESYSDIQKDQLRESLNRSLSR